MIAMHIKYYKQTQLEAMSSEKTAAEFQLEKEMKRIQEVQVWLQLIPFYRMSKCTYMPFQI